MPSEPTEEEIIASIQRLIEDSDAEDAHSNAPEPTMEEILASIRRIIAEDDEPIVWDRAEAVSVDFSRQELPSGAAGLAFRVLAFFGQAGEARAGDLLELYQEKVRVVGAQGAKWWLFWQAFWVIARLVWGCVIGLIQFSNDLGGPRLH